MPEEVASDLELPEVARHDLRRRGDDLQGGRRDDRQPLPIQVFAAGEIVPGLQALDAVSNGTVEACHTVSYYYVGKDPTFAVSSSVPFAQRPPAERLAVAGGGNELYNKFYEKFQVYGLPPQHRRADGRLVPQGDQDRRRHAGPQDAHRRIAGRCCRRSAWCRSRSPRRHLPRAGEGTIDGAEWVAPMTTRSSASTRSRRSTTIPASGGRPCGPRHVQPAQVERPAGELQEGAGGRLPRGQHGDAGQVRHGERACAEAPGRRRRAAASLPPT